MGEVNRRVKGQWPNSIWILYEVFYPLQNQKFELLVPKCPPRLYHGGSWRLSNCHIREQQKWIFLRCLIFKEFIFLKKRPWKCAISFAQLNCGNKSFEPDHQILSQCPIRRFLTVISNFLGALSKKKKMIFREIINQNSKIFLFQALRRPWFWKQREFLNKLRLRQNICIVAYPWGGICIMAHLQGDVCIMV